MKKRVLFICLGNICRSPAAEAVFKSVVEKNGVVSNFEIDSAGTYGGHAGERADARMISAASKRGYNLTSRSRKFKRQDFDNFDLLVVMDDTNYYNVCDMAQSSEDEAKVVRFAEYVYDSNITYVPDPYYQGAEGFEIVLDILEDGCSNLLHSLL